MGEENQINVLSIESKKTSRLKLQAFFKNTDGINLAAEAIDEQAAFLRLQDNTIDVVLLDLGLVDTDCIDLTKKIRKAHATVKVVVFTSSDKPDDIFAAMNAGADGYVLKG
ncbi:MAG: response regulator transcription factor, partial [Candidatus Obscuribacterales bacterium]|nr:response regulator transcription factor [Candidatus Obscuribacterales bacterium]